METDPNEAQVEDPGEGADEDAFSDDAGDSDDGGDDFGDAGESEAPSGP
jgi:hypothetical protein